MEVSELTPELQESFMKLKKIVSSYHGKILSNYYNNSRKVLFECRFGHQWKTRPYSITNLNTWCPICSRYFFYLRSMDKPKHTFNKLKRLTDYAIKHNIPCEYVPQDKPTSKSEYFKSISCSPAQNCMQDICDLFQLQGLKKQLIKEVIYIEKILYEHNLYLNINTVCGIALYQFLIQSKIDIADMAKTSTGGINRGLKILSQYNPKYKHRHNLRRETKTLDSKFILERTLKN